MAKAAVQTPDKATLDEADLLLAKREARDGNPWEFVRFQWPHLVLPADERQFFRMDLRLDDAQVEILTYAFAPDHTELFIKGCTKYGKGYAVSLVVNAWFDIFPDSKIILTGPSYDHVKDNLFAEVVAQRRLMKLPGPGDIQTDRIKAGDKHFIIIANPKSGEGFSGQHSPHTLFVFDEASAAAEMYFANARKQSRMLIALSNPRVLSGWFRAGFKESADPDACCSVQTPMGQRRLITAGGGSTVNVRNRRLEKPFAPHDGFEVAGRVFRRGEHIPKKYHEHIRLLIPAQIDYSRHLDIMSSLDETARRVFGEGKFPREDASLQVILGSWLNLHLQAWSDDILVTAFGLDVATSTDGDSTILAAGGPKGVASLHECRHANTMTTVGWVIDTIRERHGIDILKGGCAIAVDYGGGYGRGVGDRLQELGATVIKVHPNTRARMPEKYENTRAEMYGELGARLNPQGVWGSENPWGLPDDQLLLEELAAQEKIPSSDGIRFRLIPKQKPHPQYAGKTLEDPTSLGRSPDRSDAVALLWRAVSMNAVNDYGDRHLVHDLDEPETAAAECSPLELRRREWNEHLGVLIARMDGDDSSF